MSILAKAVTVTTTFSSVPMNVWVAVLLSVVVLTMLVAAPLLAWRLRIFSKGSIAGPIRVGGEIAVMPLVIVTFMAGATWLMTQVLYAAVRAFQYRHAHPGEPFTMSHLTSGDFAFLSTIPFAIGLALCVGGDVFLRQRMIARIGYSLGNAASGIGKGFLAMVIVLPIMWGASFVLQGIYDLFGYQHPAEHELLGAMKDAPLFLRGVIIIGACVAAPIFEEMLFRGHVQTILTRLFTPKPLPQLPPMALIADPAAETIPIPPPLETPAVDTRAFEPPPALVWTSVVITSIIFAVVHPLWMAPLIFVLSMCLGYAYERTGNLWVNITMHALFNASSTLIFLNMGQ